LFRTARHTVRTQHGVTANTGQRIADVEIRSYLRDQAGSLSLVFDLSITHDLYGSSSLATCNRTVCYRIRGAQDLDVSLCLATQHKINGYRQQYAYN
jgi:hypothetical protein